jgi:hypothetical protein
MSSNELNFDKNNTMIQKERNCIERDGSKKFNVNYKAMSYDDKCFVDIDTRQSIGPGNYGITNLYDCECLIPNTVKNATDNVLMTFKNGYGTENGCVVDDGSKLRIGLHRKYPKCNQQLFERPYKTVPLMAKGVFNANEESVLKFAEDTRTSRSNNTLSGVTLVNQWVPLVDSLYATVQDPKHIVQESVDPSWRRGGVATPLLTRDFDFQSRCGKKYMNRPEYNAEFWKQKGSLLSQ